MLFRCFSLVPSSLVVLSLWPLYYSFSLLPVSLCFNASQIVSAEIVSSCMSASLLLMLLSHCQCPQSSVRCKQVSSILGATVMVQTMSKNKSLKISSYNRKFSNLSFVSDFFCASNRQIQVKRNKGKKTFFIFSFKEDSSFPVNKNNNKNKT